ncbi:hypothetical protein FHG87_025620 [Trinorchestia longiramus]|nr:hypothetical protein FHG87_025620 [Trinorchestia longiramus]
MCVRARQRGAKKREKEREKERGKERGKEREKEGSNRPACSVAQWLSRCVDVRRCYVKSSVLLGMQWCMLNSVWRTAYPAPRPILPLGLFCPQAYPAPRPILPLGLSFP